MKTVIRFILTGLALTLAMTSGASAETRFVGDSLVITVRELADDTSTRIKNIVTDTQFEVLEVSGEYLKVRLEDGTEGFVKTRYTTTATPKLHQIEKLTREKATLEKQYADLTASLGEKESTGIARQKALQAELDELKKTIAQKTADNTRLSTELANLDKQYTTLKSDADNVVQIVNQSEKLRADHESMSIELESLQGENAMLLRTAVIKWVLTGAGILILGWIMGKASRSKRRY